MEISSPPLGSPATSRVAIRLRAATSPRSCSKWILTPWCQKRPTARARRSGCGRQPAGSRGEAMNKPMTVAKIFLGLGFAAVLGGCNDDGGGNNNFTFNAASADRYVRIDRMGEPALATPLLSKTVDSPTPVDGNGKPVNPGSANKFNNFNDQRDAFNRSDPVNDARFRVHPDHGAADQLACRLPLQARPAASRPRPHAVFHRNGL